MRPERESRPVGNGPAEGISVGAKCNTSIQPMPELMMSKADRGNLERLARKRAKVARAMIGERVKKLRADVEDQLSAEFTIGDELWAELNREAQAAVAKADARIHEQCRKLGIPDEFRPRLSLAWQNRGGNADASRRAELRKLAYARIDAAAESAKVTIEANLLDVETELIRGGLESAEAIAYVDAMPTTEQLLPTVDVGELKPGESNGRLGRDEYRGHYGGWEPPPEAAGQLLTPSTASNRDEKRQAVAAALAANPAGSNRQIAQLAGVDHKTVGKLRGVGGESPQPSGEIPGNGGEIPTSPERSEVAR